MEQTARWVFDFSHSRIGFSVKHFGITETEGSFRKFDGNIQTGKDDFSDMQVELQIDTDSVDTNDNQRDGHLKSPDFFETNKFPLIKFKNSRLDLVSKHNYKMYGELTIRDITKPVILDLEYSGLVPKDPFGNTKAGFLISGKINRKEWGITWNAALDHGGVAVSDTVKIFCPIQLLKLGNQDN